MNNKPTRKEVEAKRQELLKDERATANYWNGDSWGSIDGHREADRWVKNELAKFRKGAPNAKP